MFFFKTFVFPMMLSLEIVFFNNINERTTTGNLHYFMILYHFVSLCIENDTEINPDIPFEWYLEM